MTDVLSRLREIEKGDGSVCQRDVNVILAAAIREIYVSLPSASLDSMTDPPEDELPPLRRDLADTSQ